MLKELKIYQSITPRDSESLAYYFNDISDTRLLTPDEEVELAMRIKEGDINARNELVKCNLRFVISVAKQYQNTGIALEDLINEGNIGLIRAAERFDPTKGFKFDTFAVWWIRQAISISLAELGRTVRLPLNIVGQLTRIHKAERAFEQKYERLPSAEELSEMLDLPVDRIRDLMNSSTRASSLDAPLTEDSDTTMAEMLPSVSVPSADAELIRKDLQYDISVALTNLPPREELILRMYFGLDGGEEHTLEDIATTMHLTRERVRQIREKALRTMMVRHADLLKKYVS